MPQSQYNTIKSLFDGSSTSNVRMIRPNNSFVEALGGVNINDLMVLMIKGMIVSLFISALQIIPLIWDFQIYLYLFTLI